MKHAEDDLAKAREEALTLHWEQASANISAAAKLLASLYPGGGHAAHWVAGDPLLTELHWAQQRIDRALTLAAGLEIVAQADRSGVVAGEPFIVDAESRCRKEAGCALGKLQLVLPAGATQTASGADAAKGAKFTVTIDQSPAPPNIWEQQQPEPPALATATQEVTIAGYSFTATQVVTHIEATSTRIDRVAVRMVPAYTLALEPDQEIELLAKPKKPFDVLLRVHSYAIKPAKVEVGLSAPQGWTVTPDVVLQFSGTGDLYAKLNVTPPANLSRGTYPVTAFVQRGEEKFTTSLAPLPSLPTLLWSEPAECRVFAFDATVPENLRVGYISAESEPVPEALERLGIHVEMLDAAALAFGDLSRFDAVVVGVRAYELRPELAGRKSTSARLRFVRRHAGGAVPARFRLG